MIRYMNPAAPAAPRIPSSAPASDRVRARMDPKVAPLVPEALLDTRIGTGTVASEFDRAVRVRVEGRGDERRFVPETTAAANLLASPAGPRFERLLRSTANTPILDAAKGVDDLHAITLVPDEHAAKAVELLGRVLDFARETGEPVRFSEDGSPAAEKAAIREFAGGVAKDLPAQLAFSAGWNGGGDILIAPDVSRNLLAGIDGYAYGPGDALLHARNRPGLPKLPTTERPPSNEQEREFNMREALTTLTHERHHSITPMGSRGSETTSIFEEVAAEVLGVRERGIVQRAAGADVPGVVKDAANAVDEGNLGWKPWNRDHLPKPPAGLVDTAQDRYTDGPRVVRELMRTAGIDLRTTDGRRAVTEILQGGDVARAPRRLADALIKHLGVDMAHREELVGLVKKSVQHEHGSKLVTDRLAELGAQLG